MADSHQRQQQQRQLPQLSPQHQQNAVSSFAARRLPAVSLLVLVALTAFPLSAAKAQSTPVHPAGNSPVATADWYVIRFNDDAVGYERITSQPPIRSERSGSSAVALLRHRLTRLQLKRLGRDLSVAASLETSEATDGSLLSFSLQRTDASGASIERSGVRQEDSGSFEIEETVQATHRKYRLTAPPHVWSPIMAAWVGGPVLANIRRDTRPVLFPETAGISDIVVESGRTRVVRLSDQQQLKLQSAAFYPFSDPTQRTAIYIDDGGTVIVQEQPLLGGTLKLEKTSAEVALSSLNGKSIDLDTMAVIPVDTAVRNATAGESQILELRTKGPLRNLIPAGSFQHVELAGDRSARITLLPVERSRRRTPAPLGQREKLPSTRWMPTDDPRIQQLAFSGAVGETDGMQLCLRLERFLHSKMQHSAFSTSMVPADEVARTLRGDCTEHAVLLAAMMRVHGIHSRVVSGLVAATRGVGFVGHMWTEARIGDEWVPFDSTLQSSEFDVPHIRLADSELPDDMVSGVTLFIPVLDLAGRAEIHVIRE
ncbi:MAG: transglutaminase-like domain-containing protein [Planctomycetaceae bacterium]